jgi:hypothetical protein
MNDMKQIFILGLIVGMILGGIIIVSSFFLGNSYHFLDQFHTPKNLAPYFQKKTKGLFSSNNNKPPYRIKRIDRNGKNYVYILEGGDKNVQNENKMHPNRSPIKVAPL